MIQITKGGKVRGVTVGAFKDTYEPLGWELFDENALTPPEAPETPPAGSAGTGEGNGAAGNENGSQDENSGAGDDPDDEDIQEEEHANDDGLDEILEKPVSEMTNKELAKAARYLEIPMKTEDGNKRKAAAVRKDVAKKIAEKE